MLIGLLLRDFKSYSGINYIPLIKKESHIFTAISGVNGIGKSAVFESLDAFFNDGRWNLRKNGKRNEAMIAPVFLILKSEIKGVTDKGVFEKLSVFFRELETGDFPTNQGLKDLCDHRDSLQIDYSKYYLIICPYLPFLKNLDQDKFEGPFAISSLNQKLSNFKFTQKSETEDIFLIFANTKNKLRSLYSFVYYPAECRVDDVTKVHAVEMKCLTGKNLENEIDQILKTPKTTGGNSESIFDSICTELDNFLGQLNSEMEKIDPAYKYKTKQGVAQKMSAKDLRECIIETFFRSKALKLGTMELEDLSSGQQRKALLDVAYAFLSGGSKPQKKVIFAIDEPELSMHGDSRFDQFSRVSDLAIKHGLQTMVTTHWYGFMPLAIKASWLHMPETEMPPYSFIRSFFDLEKGLEERKNFPDEISIRSIFDFASSIFSVARNKQQNWLVCEGSDDARYLHYLLGREKDRLKIKIVPVGGSGLVMKIYNYLKVLAEDENQESDQSGKIVCLIDSDKNRIPCSESHDLKNRIFLRRLQLTADSVSLVRPHAGGDYSQTEIEDCLPAKDYWQAIVQYSEELNDEELTEIISKVEFNTSAIYAGVSLNVPAFVGKYNGNLSDLEKFKNFVVESESAKKRICEIVSQKSMSENLDAVSRITSLYEKSIGPRSMPSSP